jgi:hypothetical protein
MRKPSNRLARETTRTLIALAVLSLLVDLHSTTAYGQDSGSDSMQSWTDPVAESQVNSVMSELRRYKPSNCLKPSEVKNRNKLVSHATDVSLAYQALIANESWSWPSAKRDKAAAAQGQLNKTITSVSGIQACALPGKKTPPAQDEDTQDN